MSPDQMINEIFRIQNERDPESDPGDIVIDIQDDMPMTLVIQPSKQSMLNPYLGIGDSIQAALEDALENVRRG